MNIEDVIYVPKIAAPETRTGSYLLGLHDVDTSLVKSANETVLVDPRARSS